MDLDDALALLGGGGGSGSGFDFPMEEASQENVAPPVAAAAPKQAASKKKTAAPKKNSAATAASAPKSAKASATSSAVARPASAKPKAAATKPLAASAKANAADPTPSDDMSIEERYQKKTQLEHILLRPDTYVGSIEKSTATMWVHDSERMVLKNVTYVPGLYKIFDEILVNAADNKVRDAKQDTIAVDIDTALNTISVYNNGSGIPVDMHKEEGVYVPELIFGHLLTSSNYDDSEKKTTGGRNGYGAKLANIFSTEFVVETADGSRQKKYRQTFRDNMSVVEEPVITKCKASENYTRITFTPDLERFGMTTLDEDIVSMFRRRVYDVSGCLGKTLKVSFNGEKLAVKTFVDYMNLYVKSGSITPAFGACENGAEPKLITERVNDRWEVGIVVSDGQFQQVSFANNIATTRGGTHVDYVMSQITSKVTAMVKKKNKNGTELKPHQVKNHCWVFVNSLVDNPSFDSQTKETMTLRKDRFGSTCELSEKFLKDVISKSGIIDAILSFASLKQNKDLKKNDGKKTTRLTGIPKLDDANDAGGRNSQKCTLILTEGDSAKSLAVSGLGVVGRDHYGVFPLRGKLLNVREATHTQVMANAELNYLKQILGLKHGHKYEDTKSLRYGKVLIMTDQDHDGSHIKGLLINMFDSHFPSLLQRNNFLQEFVTPIVKATKGSQTKTFYTMPEYEAWCENTNTRGWNLKYYKGLGTSTAAEAKQYFKAFDQHRKDFVYEDAQDSNAIDLAFSKKRVEDRKEWMMAHEPGTFLDNECDSMTYKEFVNKELILFSLADLQRSIPSVMDGLKPGQRKILFSCFRRKLTKDIKVAQLAGYVSEHAAYHHGETSLAQAIIQMAQDFVGSNNVNLLVPSGQFGTRLQGGKDAASPRYVFTRLAPMTRLLFPEADDNQLKILTEEGQSIEPEWYAPILPMVLVNGADGIGTGWSTQVPNYNPKDIVDNLKRLMLGEEMEEMTPWWRGFAGHVVRNEADQKGSRSYTVSGCVEKKDATTVIITELPVRSWTQGTKDMLEGMMKPGEKGEPASIIDFKENHTDTMVSFTVTMTEAQMEKVEATGLWKTFKLSTQMSTSNMNLFAADGRIKKYATPEAIIEDFYNARLKLYEARKAAQLASAEAEMVKLSAMAKFILAVCDGKLTLAKKAKAQIEKELEKMGLPRLENGKKKKAAAAEDDDDEEEDEGSKSGGSYEYLLKLPLSSLTRERVDALLAKRGEQEALVATLRARTPKEAWMDDLESFTQAWDAAMVEHAVALKAAPPPPMPVAKKAAAKKPAAATKKPAATKRGGDSPSPSAKPAAKKRAAKAAVVVEVEDSDEEEDDDDDCMVVSPPPPRAAAPKRAAKKAVVVEESDDDDFDDDSEEEDGDDSDFE
ncbi:hypothetical protein PPROV_001106000 [Pycnococcus provasolii]|uniref:DNA topoisomerase 2 n=1 Tax=Pycnococcus provasolii TaxID=41880 RepID=A0A830HYM1_9CHLO|nr:hypothetical protein PPROV_001106000 [Pycnococcus provasolii]